MFLYSIGSLVSTNLDCLFTVFYSTCIDIRGFVCLSSFRVSLRYACLSTRGIFFFFLVFSNFFFLYLYIYYVYIDYAYDYLQIYALLEPQKKWWSQIGGLYTSQRLIKKKKKMNTDT